MKHRSSLIVSLRSTGYRKRLRVVSALALLRLLWSVTKKGRVGFGKGKAKEVPEAIRKATEQAKRQLIRVPLREGRTLHHDIQGRHGAGKVVMRTAPTGTGIIAGGPMRAVFEMLGIQDVVAKSVGSQNPYNMIRATIDGLVKEASPRMVAQRRGKKVADILNKDIAPSAKPEEAVDA
jgi:small subunit ribosomal protein S5